ncbi:MAG: DASS family sodium-coupled anion symporter, partial [Melioribacteraceae bacterium]
GVLMFVLILLLPAPKGMSATAWHTTAVALLMAFFWITEALPLYVTALIPIVLFPILNISAINETTAPFGHPLIFLFLGGFLLAEGIQKWGLHKRIALKIIKFVGVSPKRIIAGFMLGSAFLSMWISNTATALMMLPIGLSVISVIKSSKGLSEKNQRDFSIALLLSIAYSCSIGGIATLIGTPPNALMSAFMNETYQVDISFAKWMLIGLPFTLITLPITYLLLTRVIFKLNIKLDFDKSIIENEIKNIGKISKEERYVQVVFLLIAVLWIARPLVSKLIPGISDASIAILGALILFIIPSTKNSFILEWKDAQKIAWGILILFGGGLSLAQGIKNSGLAEWIANAILSSGEIPIVVLVLILTTSIIFLTELTSNLATTAAFLPIIASIGVGMGINPLQLVVPATIAASCAFMLPVATPPNAIIFSSNEVTIKDMTRAGILLNVIFVVMIVLLTNTFGGVVFGY